jgi:hypothetical protein
MRNAHNRHFLRDASTLPPGDHKAHPASLRSPRPYRIDKTSYLWEGMWVCLVSIEAERVKIGNKTIMSRMLLRRTIGSKPKLVFMKLPMSSPSPKARHPITHIMALRRD